MHPAPAPQPRPGGGGRLPVLDVLRGVAILGILLMNIQSFGRLSSEYINPKALGDPPPLDWAVWLMNHVIADDKFITMLTLLFGAGIVLMAQGSKESAAAFERGFRRRMAWLLVFGLVHALVLWPGDILAAYAVCGTMAVSLRHRPPAELAWLGILLFAGATVLWIGLSVGLVFLMPAGWVEYLASHYWVPRADVVYQEVHRLVFAWLPSVGERALNALISQAWMFVSDRVWRMLGMMLLGMALVRIGFLSGEWSLQAYRRVAIAGLCTGIPAVVAGVWFNEAVGWEFRYSMFLGRIANHWASVAIALAWVSLVVLMVRHQLARRLTGMLEAVGRLAMTNYLGQSILCVGLFYGVGFGLFTRLGHLELLGVVILVWAIQIAFSLVWRRYRSMGPFEALWRRLAAG